MLAALGFKEPATVTPVAANRGKGVWRIDNPSGSWALRVLRPGEDATAHGELTMMEAARAGGVPVPEVATAGTWKGRPAMLLAWCPGQTLHGALRRRPWAAGSLGRACGRAQAFLHRIAAPADSVVGSWIHRFGDVDPALSERLATADAGSNQLLHLDYHEDNLLLDRGTVSAVLDWTNACGGDPRADLARSWSLLTNQPRRGGARQRAIDALHQVVARGWRAGYEDVADRQDDMPLFELWALEALLGTLHGEARRWGSSTDLTHLAAQVNSRRAAIGLP